MISPSETAYDRNSETAAAAVKLEFKAVDHLMRRKTDWNPNAVEDELREETLRLQEKIATLELRLMQQQQQAQAQIAEAKRLGKMEAKYEGEAELQEKIQKERRCIEKVCADFAKDRQRYFAAVEGEVVRLALAIAERVLHRESKMDPLLLCATVRLALDKLGEDSTATLHVPAGEAELWRWMLSEESKAHVQVVGEERMEPTECVLETNVGRVELGVAVQLEEIEKGFFDLMQLRPS